MSSRTAWATNETLSQRKINTRKTCHLIVSPPFSMKDLRPPDEDSHIVKIQRPNERSKRRESEVPRRASAVQGGFSFFQTVGYLTGDMKECQSWLKGKQGRAKVSKGEQGAVHRQTASPPAWPTKLFPLSHTQQGLTQRGEAELTPGGHEPN